MNIAWWHGFHPQVLNRSPGISSLLLVYISRSRHVNVGTSAVTCDDG
jgi:hypothetical protein